MRLSSVLVVLTALSAAPAIAADPLLVTWDKARILRLPESAAQVIIGNPAYVDVTVETPELLILFGKQPGETNLLILNADNKEIMSVPVAVVPEGRRHVTVHSPLRGGTGAAETVYGCAGPCVLRTAAQPGAVAPVALPPAAPPEGGEEGQEGQQNPKGGKP